MNNQASEKQKNRVTTIVGAAILGLGVAIMIFGMRSYFLSEAEIGYFYIVLGIGLVPIFAGNMMLVRRLRNYMSELTKANYDRLNASSHASLAMLSSPEAMRQAFLDLGFSNHGPSLQRRVATLFCDRLVYTAEIRRTNLLEETLKDVVVRFDALVAGERGRTPRNNILFVILYMDAISAADAERAKQFAIERQAVPYSAYMSTDVIVPILYDGTKQCFAFMDCAGHSQKRYNLGMRYFKTNILHSQR